MKKVIIKDKHGKVLKILLEFDGYKFPTNTLVDDPLDYLERLATLEFKDTDVFILTYPKSGTHWIYEVVNMLRNGNANFHSYMTPVIGARTIPYIKDVAKNGVFLSHFYIRHLPKRLREKKCKIIHMYRNPKDIAVSYFEFRKKLKFVEKKTTEMSFEDFLLMFLDGNVMGGLWIDWMMQLQDFEQDNPDYPILNISYEDMKKDLQQCVQRLDAFLDLGSSSQLISEIATKCDFEVMSKFKGENIPQEMQSIATLDEDIHYRKGEVGDWKNYFTVAEDELFTNRLKDRLADLRLDITYEI